MVHISIWTRRGNTVSLNQEAWGGQSYADAYCPAPTKADKEAREQYKADMAYWKSAGENFRKSFPKPKRGGTRSTEWVHPTCHPLDGYSNPVTLNQHYLGDPLPGKSALDKPKRKHKSKITLKETTHDTNIRPE